jgi:hypothetical protein
MIITDKSHKRCVWDCGSGDGSKCFSLRNASK